MIVHGCPDCAPGMPCSRCNATETRRDAFYAGYKACMVRELHNQHTIAAACADYMASPLASSAPEDSAKAGDSAVARSPFPFCRKHRIYKRAVAHYYCEACAAAGEATVGPASAQESGGDRERGGTMTTTPGETPRGGSRRLREDSIVTLEGLQAYAEARADGLLLYPGLSLSELAQWDNDDAVEWAEELGTWGRRALALRALLARCAEDAR